MTNDTYRENKISYSKFLSALFSSVSIIALSILCLLNNLSLDLYSAICLFKVVIPAGMSFWFLGFVIGKKLDGLNVKIIENEIKTETQAYEIPSMFQSADSMELGADMEDFNV